METDDLFIHSKLRLPFLRSNLVLRPQLQKRVEQGIRGLLTLITAPAGFGKTTLVASCVASCGLPVAWLSLDKNDNKAERFLNYLVATLQEADHTIGKKAAQLMSAAQPASSETILTSLINDLDTSGREIVLVLDDYQFISSQAAHEEVAFLLEHCPKTLHLVIATRSDPLLPLARLRAHNQAVELRASDLRFSEPEAVQFLNEVMGLHLNERAVAVLEDRTEGWIAGLQMAALSMHEREDVNGFIEEFSGTNRYILDYLMEEVLASQSPELQRFLLYTSILERLTAPLCDAILADDKGSQGGDNDRSTHADISVLHPSTSILDYLEKVNLFLVPLDDERSWYRYHHLFADLLRSRLQRTYKDQEIAFLHTRAAQWYEQNGLTSEAIHHASLTSDNEWVERLIEQNYMEMFQRRDNASIGFWTGELSREMIYKRPRLCIHEGMNRAWLGKLDDADLFLNEAEKRIQEGASSGDTQDMLGNIAYIRSRITAMRGDIRQAIELGLTASKLIPASNQALLGGIGVMLGYAYFLDGDFANAIQVLNKTIHSGKTAGAINTTVAAYCVLARLHTVQGQLNRSFELYQEAGKLAHEAGGRQPGVMSIVDVGIADVMNEWNDLEGALTHVKKGLEVIPLWNKKDDFALAYITLSRIQLAQENMADAVKTIENGSQVIHSGGVFSEARDAVISAEIKLQLAQGNLPAVGRLTSSIEKRLDTGDPYRFQNELAFITLARVFITQNKLDEAIKLLSRLDESAQSGGRMGRLIEILILKAIATQKLGEPSQALELLERSLALAEPEGYIRIYVDEGEPMRLLLTQWIAHANDDALKENGVRLLSNFNSQPHPVATSQEKTAPTSTLVEPLSQRELEVLHILALGKTNQEIAQKLIVAPGTVKAHTANIYRKLDVANRTEAVARARQLGILP